MSFSYSVLHPERGINTFTLNSDSLELNLLLLGYIVRSGQTLLQARQENADGRITVLPVKTIDGESVSAYLERLQQEWQELLKKNP